MVLTSAPMRALGALLTISALLCLLLLTGEAVATEPAATEPAATSVGALGAEPTVRVARHRHCIASQLRMIPRYSGGSVAQTYLFLNGRSVARRHGNGALKLSAKRLLFGANSFELISHFRDGRTASVVGTLNRCGR